MASFTERTTLKALTGTDQVAVAHILAGMLIDEIAATPKAGGKETADRLRELETVMWEVPAANTLQATREQETTRKERVTSLIKGLSTEETRHFAEGYARLGHMFEISGQIARANFFAEKDESFAHYLKQSKGGALRNANMNEIVPGGVQEMLFLKSNPQFSTAQKTVDALNKPVFEPVFTMHPTNLNSQDSLNLQREIAFKAENVSQSLRGRGEVNGELDELRTSLKSYVETPITPMAENGTDRNFTVFDETKLVLQFVQNIYDDLPRVYAEFDRGLAQKFGDEYAAIKADLNLNMPLSSWGSAGDKDGNANVKSENTLEAIALHKQALFDNYARDLEALSANGEAKELAAQWLPLMREASKTLQAEIAKLEERRAKDPAKNDIALSQDEFAVASKEIASARFDAKAFAADIRTDLDKQPESEGLLNLLRRARNFGDTFARIEYRETAEEYARAADRLIPAETIQQVLNLDKPTRYAELVDDEGKADTEKRTKLLTALLTERPDDVRAMGEAFMQQAKGETLRKYSPENADAITYHSLKRMELARDHPEMIRNNVLAECQDTSNLLEAQLLQIAASTKEKRALLGVVPLFEEPDTMSRATKIMAKAYDNAAYQEQLKTIAEARHDGVITQQVQIAHSDNARRSGVAAARGFIHAVHPLLREETAKHNIAGKPISLQFYEGGSQSDAYRNGVRAITAMVNAFDLHDFTKLTFQGGDLPNYFNVPGSLSRLMVRHFVHSATAQADPARDTVKRYGALEKTVTEALIGTLQHYEADHFNPRTNPIGHLFADPRIDYMREAEAGNASSRAASRTGTTKTAANDDGLDPALAHVGNPVPTDKMRTISFSKAFQHGAGIVPSWVGTESLWDHLNVSLRDLKKKGEFDEKTNPKGYNPQDFTVEIRDRSGNKHQYNLFEKAAFEPNRQELTPLGLNLLYQASPAFRDNIDKCAYGLLMSDMTGLSKRITKNSNISESTVSYLHHLTDNYKAAFSLVHRALTGDNARLTYGGERESERPDVYRHVLETMPELSHLRHVAPKIAYLDAATAMRESEAFNEDAHIRRIVHNAKDTVYHGRTLAADDIRYGIALAAHEQQQKRGGR